MKWIVTVAMWVALAGLVLPAATAQAETAAPELKATPKPEAAATDISAQRRRPLRRVPIYSQEWAPSVYPRYNPGPNAVRDCTAHYVQEYRPSGTVITPRMNCYWRPG
jgi:hypothetical protein